MIAKRPLRHRYRPTHYYRTLGTHEPVVSIGDGDTVVTSTVDAGGGDAAGEQVTPRGNPQTGPFHVDGAEPGDALAVTLHAVTPNRATGFTTSPVDAQVLEPGFDAGTKRMVDWRLDLGGGTATPIDVPGLEALQVPLRPMIGCFGVAPDRGEAISTATSGAHGGNMDYAGFVAGVTVWFPVSVPGALFFLGDVHAVQGDGEITGNGVEVSADVTFSVRVLSGRTIAWPRAISGDHLMTVGCGRPLDQCVQYATGEMLRWLGELGLPATAAHTLLGQAVEYDLGNIYDPAYTMICKIRTDTLRAIGLSPDEP